MKRTMSKVRHLKDFDFSKFPAYSPSGRRDKPEVMNLSGGRSSAFVLMMLINGGFGQKDDDFVLFQNTGDEDKSCYDFLKNIESIIPVHYVEYCNGEMFYEDLMHPDFNYDRFYNNEYNSIDEILDVEKLRSWGEGSGDRSWSKNRSNFWYKEGYSYSGLFREVTNESASRNARPFCDIFLYRCAIRIMKGKGLILPNAAQRWCTGDMKEKVVHRFLRSKGIKEYIDYMGIRADEPRRVDKVFRKNDKYGNKVLYDCPAHWMKVTKLDVLKGWKAQPFDLGRGFEEKDNNFNDFKGNCKHCHLKTLIKKLYLIQQGYMPNFYIQVEKLVENYNGEKDAMSRHHGTYQEMVERANKIDKISVNEVLSDEEVEITCFGCGD